MPLPDMLQLWPSAQAQADDLLARAYLFFWLEQTAFYFHDDDLTHLYEVLHHVTEAESPSAPKSFRWSQSGQ